MGQHGHLPAALKEAEGLGPGNTLVLEVEAEHVTGVFSGFGERGRPAEDVTREAGTNRLPDDELWTGGMEKRCGPSAALTRRRYTSRIRAALPVPLVASGLIGWQSLRAAGGPQEMHSTTMHGKVMCGYQGWFRCPGDAAGMGWVHPSDEVDEGTAVFKVTSSPPVQGHFAGFGGLPSDWHLRLARAAASQLRQRQRIPLEIPIKP